MAEFDQAAGFRQPRFKEWGGAADLRDERLRADPRSPRVAGQFDKGGGQTTSMTRRRSGRGGIPASPALTGIIVSGLDPSQNRTWGS